MMTFPAFRAIPGALRRTFARSVSAAAEVEPEVLGSNKCFGGAWTRSI